MRIIAGHLRHRTLLSNPGLTTRPITDRVKETLFELLGPTVVDLRVADLFAGTGTLGFEALSRSAKSVVFIEKDRVAFELLQQNTAKLKVEDQVLCWQTDALRSSYCPKGVSEFVPFDLIFFDPPYRMAPHFAPGESLYTAMQRLARDQVSSPEARVIFRIPEKLELSPPPEWSEDWHLEMSSMRILVWRKSKAVKPE